MSRNIVLQLNTDLQLPQKISFSAQGERALRIIIESLLAQGLASVSSEVPEALKEETNISELKSVTVWFEPSEDHTLKPNAPVILNDVNASAFEDILKSSTLIDTDIILKKIRGHWSTSACRAQIFAQPGTTDIRTANTIANYFRAIEQSDFTAVESMLAPDMTCRVPEKFYSQVEMRSRDEYLAQVIPLRQRYKELWFDVTWAYVQSTRAVIEFCLWSEGKVVCSGLTQYSFEIIDDVPIIYSIYSHSVNADGSVIAAEDGTLQWTQLNP